MAASLPPPLGTHWSGQPGKSSLTVAVPVGPGVTNVDFCLIQRGDNGECTTETRFPLPCRLGNVVWGEIEGIAVGATYGLRASGGSADPTKLLVDPYARAITGTVNWQAHPGAHRLGSAVDTANLIPFGVVIDPSFDWGAESDRGPDRLLKTPWDQTVIYEANVRSATKLHPGVPEPLRGTYAGIANSAFIEHLVSLGITAIELLPVHEHVDEERLAGLGLTNHWGYNTLGFFAPDQRYSASGTHGPQVNEFKGMVKLLHEAGIEVLLDVVYNHTGEGGRGGAALSFRGLDPEGWYREPDVTGCGNTVDLRQPAALRLVLDSLRYWVTECHVDGFRFDLAPALCRTDFGYSATSTFLSAVYADPVLSQVKLISEPWDIGVGGYQLGAFPAPWAEWNDRYRDTVRDLWCGSVGSIGEAAGRITGSSDLFAGSRRAPWASINFVAAHDGMCTADLCAYNGKHNEANKEENRDGTDNNRSNNCGVEGQTSDVEILERRAKLQRNMLATLLLSHGTPMLLCGDEVGHSQLGNNNAYCQDNEISWIDWNSADWKLSRFVSQVIALRRAYPALRHPQWLRPQDANWLSFDGLPMDQQKWASANGFSLQLRDPNSRSVVLALNNSYEKQHVVLPSGEWDEWTVEIDTAVPLDSDPQPNNRVATTGIEMSERSLIVLSGSKMTEVSP
jgi:isoamylase